MHIDETAPDPIAVPRPVVISPVEPKVEIVGEAPAAMDLEPEPEAEPVHCRHCGEQAPEGTDPEGNWLCKDCGRHQNSMVCPTCHSVVSASQLPKDMVPAAHAPRRRRKAKE